MVAWQECGSDVSFLVASSPRSACTPSPNTHPPAYLVVVIKGVHKYATAEAHQCPAVLVHEHILEVHKQQLAVRRHGLRVPVGRASKLLLAVHTVVDAGVAAGQIDCTKNACSLLFVFKEQGCVRGVCVAASASEVVLFGM